MPIGRYYPTARCVSGYLWFVDEALVLSASASVSVPTLPMYIDIIMTLLPASDKPAVIPVLKPTVANAETCSKATRKISYCASVIDNTKIKIKLSTAANVNMEKAL